MKYKEKEKESKRERRPRGGRKRGKVGGGNAWKTGAYLWKKRGRGDKNAERDEREGGGRARGRREYMTLSVGMEGYFENVIGRKLLRTSLD